MYATDRRLRIRAGVGHASPVEVFPRANTWGSTLDEARENLREAVDLIVKAIREQAPESTPGRIVTRETMEVQA